MKRLSRGDKVSKLNAGRRRWIISLRRAGRTFTPNKVYRVKKGISGETFIVAPQHISIYEFEGKQSPYRLTMDFIDDIHNVASKKSCTIDFSNTKRVTTAALVTIYAAIEDALYYNEHSYKIAWSQQSEHVNRILKSSNISKLIQKRDISYALDSARSMPIVSSIGNEQMEEIIDYIQKRIYRDKMSPSTEHIYGDAVSETINNVGLHAYPEVLEDEKRWWLTCDTFDKSLYLAIYDRGVGIPKTVVDRPWFLGSMKVFHPETHKQLMEEGPDSMTSGIAGWVFTKVPDEDLIYLSMQGDVSGTKKNKHGQGSKSIMKLVSETKGGTLWVFSNNGLLTSRQAEERTNRIRLARKFPGTLVQWNIELP